MKYYCGYKINYLTWRFDMIVYIFLIEKQLKIELWIEENYFLFKFFLSKWKKFFFFYCNKSLTVCLFVFSSIGRFVNDNTHSWTVPEHRKFLCEIVLLLLNFVPILFLSHSLFFFFLKIRSKLKSLISKHRKKSFNTETFHCFQMYYILSPLDLIIEFHCAIQCRLCEFLSQSKFHLWNSKKF